MTVHIVHTYTSVWFFDVDNKRYQRHPKVEGPADHPYVPYEEGWHGFDDLKLVTQFGGKHIVLLGAGNKMRHRMTGEIEENQDLSFLTEDALWRGNNEHHIP